MRRNFVLAVSVVMAGAMLAATAPVGAAPAAPIAGTIVSATPDTVVLNTAQGNKTIKTTATTTVISRAPRSWPTSRRASGSAWTRRRSATRHAHRGLDQHLPPAVDGEAPDWAVDDGQRRHDDQRPGVHARPSARSPGTPSPSRTRAAWRRSSSRRAPRSTALVPGSVTALKPQDARDGARPAQRGRHRHGGGDHGRRLMTAMH